MPIKKDILFIISETSGKQVNILPEIKKLFANSKKTYDYKKVKKPSDAVTIVKNEADKYKTIAVYGGDGTVTAALKSVALTNAAFMLLPGGTANTLAKGLHLPEDPLEIVKAYKAGKTKIVDLDLAEVNGRPLAFNMHFGILTRAITDTPRPLKKRFGPLAYAFTALKQLPQVDKFNYQFEINGKIKNVRGYGMFVSNQGEQSFLGIKLFPKPHKSGYVQIAIAKNLTPIRVLIWIGGRLLHIGNRGGAIKLYRTRHLKILSAPNEQYFGDETLKLKLPLEVKGGQQHVKTLVV